MASSSTVEIFFTDLNEGVVTKWKVQEGRSVTEHSVLCEYKNPNLNKIKCQFAGTITQILKKENDSVKLGDVIAVLEKCSHSTVWRNVCADCGSYITEAMNVTASKKFVAMEHCVPDLLVSEENALELGKKDEHRLLRIRKLVLLVDLDQTIIHTTNDNVPPNLKDVYHFRLQHGRDGRRWWYHTKLRPHTERFLKNVSEFYELHICTFGVRPYAHAIAGYLDPEKRYFQHRILSRDECFHPNLKTLNLKNLFPCGDSMVCIMDDREDVWKSAPNMIRVTPYSFFDGSADINAPPLAAKSGQIKEKEARKQTIVRIPVKKSAGDKTLQNPVEEKDVRSAGDGDKKMEGVEEKEEGDPPAVATDAADEDFVEMIEWEDDDDYLLHLENILLKIHASFYDEYDSKHCTPDACDLDLKDIVPLEKKKVLCGCNILFSGVIPLKQKQEHNWAYKLAVAFGANVQTKLIVDGDSEATTHVIGMRDGTEKIKKAHKHKIFVVNVDWLLDSIERWEKVDERLYPVSNEPSQKRMFYCSGAECPTGVAPVVKDDAPVVEDDVPVVEYDAPAVEGDLKNVEKWRNATLDLCKDAILDCELCDSSDDDEGSTDTKKRPHSESEDESDGEFGDSKEEGRGRKRCRVEEDDPENSSDEESDYPDDYRIQDYYTDDDY